MRNLNIGLLAHVDAGKTTLSENILYISGAIRNLGRVDHKDTYLDSNAMEKERGITIFSKQARFRYGDANVTLLDTPGHVDFSSEMERVLSVLDLAVLIISAPEGIQSHTRTLWKLLEHYDIPTVIFVNKMDMAGVDRKKVLQSLKEGLDKTCVDMLSDRDVAIEEISSTDEELIEEYLETGDLCEDSIRSAVERRLVFPVWFGSALKNEGVKEFLDGLLGLSPQPYYDEETFGARVFKITRGALGERLTHLKVTGGKLRARMVIPESNDEKIDQIRLYNGEKYETVSEAEAGMVVAVTGLSETAAGQGLGAEGEKVVPKLTPVLRYRVITDPADNPLLLYGKLKPLEEEYPELSFEWNERHKEIFVKVNGEIQLQVLKQVIKDRLGSEISYGAGSIVYKESVSEAVYGIGHFEPLRHYAEVQLFIEPGEAGSGIEFASVCSVDDLDKNWQRLIETHVLETIHPGTLTGSEVTDIRVVLVTGRAHPKHTEGGDFRQATYRAIRNALRKAREAGKGVLLEPVYKFTLTIPSKYIGKAMTDIDRMSGKAQPPILTGDGNIAVLKGIAPVSTFWEYTKEVTAYTAGEGTLSLELAGFEPCHNQEEVVSAREYDPEADLRRPTGSVFCAHGAGFQVPWDEVDGYAHMPCPLSKKDLERLGIRDIIGNSDLTDGYQEGGLGGAKLNTSRPDSQTGSHVEKFISIEEIDAIFASQRRNRKEDAVSRRKIYKRGRGSENYIGSKTVTGNSDNGYRGPGKAPLPKCLFVDGYNMIHAWDELRVLADNNIHGARERLIDICSEYQGMVGGELILVFDAYMAAGSLGSVKKMKNIYVVYTKEAETADQYIEQATKKKAKDYSVTVATSDNIVQLIVMSEGALRMSAREFESEIERARNRLRTDYLNKETKLGNNILV